MAPPEKTLKVSATVLSLLHFCITACAMKHSVNYVSGIFRITKVVSHFTARDKRGEIRYWPINPKAVRLINDYLDTSGQ